MPDPLAGLPPRYLRTPEAARFLGLSGRTLEKHRTHGTGEYARSEVALLFGALRLGGLLWDCRVGSATSKGGTQLVG